MEALINFLREKERKHTSEGKKEKNYGAFARPCVELSPFMLSNSIPTHLAN